MGSIKLAVPAVARVSLAPDEAELTITDTGAIIIFQTVLTTCQNTTINNHRGLNAQLHIFDTSDTVIRKR